MDSSKKPVVLMFTDWYYPAYKAGGPVQSCVNLVRALRKEFDFFVVCGDRDLGDIIPYQNVSINQWISGQFGEQVLYAPRSTVSPTKVHSLIALVQPSVVYFNSMFSTRFTLVPLWVVRQFRETRVILAPRGMLHPGAIGLKSTKKKFFLYLFKTFGVYKRLVFHATNDQEAAHIRQQFPRSQIKIAGNIPVFRTEKPTAVVKTPGELRLIFVGRIHPTKNLQMLLRLLGQLTSAKLLTLTVIGQAADEAYLQSCKGMVNDLPSFVNVEFLGAIPQSESFSGMLQAHFFILPSLGENFGHAIYEALISGKPVLISDQTPWRNLESQCAGWDLPLDQPDLFLAALHTALAMDQATYNEWSTGAYTLAYNYFTNAAYNSRYHALFT